MKRFNDYSKDSWTEGYTELDTGIRMAYTVCGSPESPAVILLHGLTDGRLAWVRFAPLIAQAGFRVYVPESRGNGLTDKPVSEEEGYTIEQQAADILAFMDALHLEKAHIAGQSMGSLVAQILNITAPERVASTMLISSTSDCRQNPVLSWGLYGDGETFPGIISYEGQPTLPEEFLWLWANAEHETEEYREAMLAHISQIPYHSWVALFKGILSFNNTDRLKEISGRVFVIWAAADDIFPQEDQDKLLAGLSDCSLKTHTILNSGHDIMRDVPEARGELLDIMISFFRGTE